MGLELADSADASDTLEVNELIGSDWYWSLATGKVIRGRGGPIAIHTKVGWLLSGPTNHQEVAVNLAVTSTHALKIDSCPLEPSLEDRLKQFWELESLARMKLQFMTSSSSRSDLMAEDTRLVYHGRSTTHHFLITLTSAASDLPVFSRD